MVTMGIRAEAERASLESGRENYGEISTKQFNEILFHFVWI